jgi:CP family cyanate transporter-like MFS transporter
LRKGAALLAALFAAAIALRPQIVGVGPLLPDIQADLDVSHAVAGLLGTIPVVCMGIFAPAAQHLAARFGTSAAIGAAIALIGAAGIGRAFAPGAVALVLLTLPVGVGIALAGTLMPVVVKKHFAGRPASATGLYTTGINVGAGLAAALAVPLALLGSWRTALLVFSAATVALAVLWFAQARGGEMRRPLRARPPRLPRRSGTAWLLTVMFGLLGISFYGLVAWLPDLYVERGFAEAQAGVLLALLNVGAIPGGVLVSLAADRFGSRRRYLVGCAAIMIGSLVGILLLPGAGWLWATLVGITNGALFALLMTLPLDVSRDPAEVGAVAGLMLGAGYSIAALAPFGLGAIRDATGSFSAPFWVIVATTALFLLLAATLTTERLRRGMPAPTASRYASGRATSR